MTVWDLSDPTDTLISRFLKEPIETRVLYWSSARPNTYLPPYEETWLGDMMSYLSAPVIKQQVTLTLGGRQWLSSLTLVDCDRKHIAWGFPLGSVGYKLLILELGEFYHIVPGLLHRVVHVKTAELAVIQHGIPQLRGQVYIVPAI